MCFYCRIVNGEIPLDPETYHLVAPLAAAVQNATSSIPDATHDRGFELLRELAVKHNGQSVLPFMDAYITFREAMRRRTSQAHQRDGERTVQAIQEDAAQLVDMPLGLDAANEMAILDARVTGIAESIVRLDPNKLQSLFGFLRSPKAGQIVAILAEARERIRSLFVPARSR